MKKKTVKYKTQNILVVGLGNVGEEYVLSRHNTGFIVLDYITESDMEWEFDKSVNGQVAGEFVSKVDVSYLKPATMMNLSGNAVTKAASKFKVKPAGVVVIYDDIDLPLGSMKLSFGKGSGGHNGIKSVMDSLNTREFVRLRVGVSPVTPTGKIRKPKGEDKVLKHLLGNFKPNELKQIKKLSKSIGEAIDTIATEGHLRAMNLYN